MIVSFTGHRPDKISAWRGAPERTELAIRKRTAEAILELAREGATTFMSGMAPGFDLWAADEVLRLRAEGQIGAEVRLVLAVPYPSFERSFGVEYRPLYEYIMARADEVVYVSPGYHHGCYQRRNAFLADGADVVLAYYEGTEGGTRQTMRMAAKQGRRVINLHQGELFDQQHSDV